MSAARLLVHDYEIMRLLFEAHGSRPVTDDLALHDALLAS